MDHLLEEVVRQGIILLLVVVTKVDKVFHIVFLDFLGIWFHDFSSWITHVKATKEGAILGLGLEI